MVHTRAFVERVFGHLAPGDLMLGKPGCFLSQRFVDDLRAIGSVVEDAAEICVPWLFVHGDRDPLVPIEDAHDAYARAAGQKQLVALEGADHVFEPGQTPRMVETVSEWCLKQWAT
jgi:pimeloyl-ACP methyl ester carboxylesterase